MSSSSRKRRLVTPQQPDEERAARRTDRIVVDVGGTRFTTSASTLSSASEYFERLLSPRWCAEPPEELFLDRDPEPFKILLTYMRTGLLELSKDNLSLARRVMIEAEFLGMVGLIDSVKARAIENTGWEGTDADAVKCFGSFDAAIRNGILPASFFPPPPPPPRKIVQLLPAPPGTRVEIHWRDDGEYSEWFDVLCLVHPELCSCALSGLESSSCGSPARYRAVWSSVGLLAQACPIHSATQTKNRNTVPPVRCGSLSVSHACA